MFMAMVITMVGGTDGGGYVGLAGEPSVVAGVGSIGAINEGLGIGFGDVRVRENNLELRICEKIVVNTEAWLTSLTELHPGPGQEER
jgi:hypothetical protein